MTIKYQTYIGLATATVLLSACNNPFGANNRYHGQQYNQSYNQPHNTGVYHNNKTYGPVNRGQNQLRGGINVNYETLSVFEAPLAIQAGNATLLLRGRIETPVQYSMENSDRIRRQPVGNYQISVETQLPNRITVGAVYGGRYENAQGRNSAYSDNIAAYAGGSWGTVFGGNVSDLVFENVRRHRGVSNIKLAGDGAIGGLSEWSGGYRGRFGPAIVSAIMDEDANYDVGVSYQRPIGTADYRFTARHNNGTFTAADNITKLDTKSINVVGEYVYGSSRFDVGGGYERIADADRWYSSAGVATKYGAWSFSAEGQYGQIEGQDEMSAVIGIKRDIARGLAATIAVDYQDRQININGLDYLNTNDTRLTMAMHYGF